MEYSRTSSVESTGFVSLLNRQTIDIDSSEMHLFNSQFIDESSGKESRRKWSPKEDVILIGAWLNTSKDLVVSNEQKAGAFWKRIEDYYNSNTSVAVTERREGLQCKQRWSRINDPVCKFAGCYDAALRGQSSGQNENDVMKAALEIYHNDYKVKFTMEHAWRELRNDQKWCSTYMKKDSGKDKRKTVVDIDGEDEVTGGRPPGVKAAKAAKRKKTGKEAELEKLQGLLDKKEKISQSKVLELLLARTEPLSALENTLKLTLMTKMIKKRTTTSD